MEKTKALEVSSWIKNIRLENQWTQKDLSAKTGLSVMTISCMENGKSLTEQNIKRFLDGTNGTPVNSKKVKVMPLKSENKLKKKKKFRKVAEKVIADFLEEHKEEILERIEQQS